MDSVYAALQGGADFSALACRYSDDTTCKNMGRAVTLDACE